MRNIPVLDLEGKEIREVTLGDYYFSSRVSVPAMHLAVRRQLAAARKGTASTKNRSAVSGGGAKPWRQKGTGRARAGSIRSPLWRGGGTIFGPQPREYRVKVNKKVRRLALRSALTLRSQEERVKVIEDFELSEPKTKEMVRIFEALGVEDDILLVLPEEDMNILKSVRNLPRVLALTVEELNTYDVLTSDWLVFTESALKRLQEGEENEGPA
jgi:large subunit ribosomal protein L4